MKYERLTKRADNYPKVKSCPKDYETISCIDCGCCDELDEALFRLAELKDKIEAGTLIELPFMRQRKNGQWEIIYIDENDYTSVRAFTDKAEAEKRLEELRGGSMNREEVIKILTTYAKDLEEDMCNDCEDNDDCNGCISGGCDRCYCLEKIEEAGKYLIKHEQDTLKEFVEFVRKYLGEREDALGRLIDSNRRVQKSLKYDDDKIAAEPVIRHEEGELLGYDKVDYWLDQILENFLKERGEV